jgi:hypothetical protein
VKLSDEDIGFFPSEIGQETAGSFFVRKVSQRLASKKAFTYVWASLHTLAITFC